MGWFSKKKKITVAVRSMTMFNRNEVLEGQPQPDTLRDTVLGAILQEASISKALSAEIARGFYSKVRRYYKYGQSTFIGGLPQALYFNFDLTNSAVIAVVNRVYTGYGTLTIRNYSIEYISVDQIAHKYLADVYGWNSVTNVYPASDKKFDGAEYINSKTEILITWKTTVGATVTITTETISNPYNLLNYHLVVEFSVGASAPADAITYLLIYDITTGIHPEIEDNTVPANPYFPIVKLRQDKININVNKLTSRYITSRAILKKLDLKIDTIFDGIMSTQDGNDPNQMDACFITFGLSILTKQKQARQYLAEYFYSMRTQGKTKAQFDTYVASQYGPAPYTGTQVREGNFNVTLSWNYITVSEHVGKYGTLRRNEVHINTVVRGNKYTVKNGEEYNGSDIVYIYQYTKNNYRMITVNGLEQGTDVYQGEFVVNSVDTVVSLTDQSAGLFIPVKKDIIDKLEPLAKNDVVMDALIMVVYAVQITYLKWYQRGKLLKIIGLIITIVVTVIFPPAGAAVATLTAAIVGTIVNIIVQIIIAQIIIKAAMYVGKLIGGDLAALLATIAAIAAIVISPGNIAAATQLLNAATGLQLAYGKELNKKIGQLEQDKLDWKKELDLAQEGIEAALKTFASQSTLDTLLNSIGLINQHETVDDYYRRTLFGTDMTQLMYELVNSYHDQQLTLPVTIEGVR